MSVVRNDLYFAFVAFLVFALLPSVTLQLLAFALLGLTWVSNKRPNGAPDGPIGFPLLGYIAFLGKFPYKTFRDLGKKYGQIFSIYMGEQFTVILNDYNSINEAFVENADIFSGRTEGFSELMFATEKDMIFKDGLEWRENRKFVMSYLKQSFGAGNNAIEQAILVEIDYLIQNVEKLCGTVFDIHDLVSKSVSNVILTQIMGKRFEYTDPMFTEIIESSNNLVRENSAVSIVIYMPWTKRIPIVKRSMDRSKAHNKKIDNVLLGMIDKVKKTHYAGSEEGFIHAYINEREQRVGTNNRPDLFDDIMLVGVIKNLFTAGSDTLPTTLRWALYFVASHPEIQMKIQKEIDAVIGSHRVPSLDDRVRMPYTEATLNEVYRIVTIAPLAAPHRTREDVKIGSYFIPKNSSVLPNLWAVHHDEKLFPNAKSFRPERFLDEAGQLKKIDYLIPFGVGKRTCLAAQMARFEAFLFLTSLLQKFTFQRPENVALSTESNIAFTIDLKSIPLRVVKRAE